MAEAENKANGYPWLCAIWCAQGKNTPKLLWIKDLRPRALNGVLNCGEGDSKSVFIIDSGPKRSFGIVSFFLSASKSMQPLFSQPL